MLCTDDSSVITGNTVCNYCGLLLVDPDLV